MQDTERKAHWEKVYTDKSPLQVSWYQTEPAMSRRLIANAGVAREAAMIDVGGGASTLVDYLLADGYQNLAVLDISAQALAHAKARLAERAAKVSWIEADITRFEPSQQYDLWHDRAVFHFLTNAVDRQKYRAALARGLKKGGSLIMAAFALDGPTQCSGLDIVRYDAAGMQQELGDEFELLEQINETHQTPANKLQHFGFYRFKRSG